jgi:hypothetical protein
MRSVLSSLLLMVLLIGCTSQAQQVPKTSKVATQKTAGSKPAVAVVPLIVFRKTPCLGTCPHYEASIYADGRVSYEGFKYAPVEGKRELKMPVESINTILAEAQAVRFAELPEHYSLGATDLPATSLTISPAAGPAKTVTVEGGAPIELNNLLTYIQKQVETSLGVSADR